MRALIALALITGARAGELLGLRWEHVVDGALTFLETKSGRLRRIPLSEAAIAVLEALPRVLSTFKLSRVVTKWSQSSDATHDDLTDLQELLAKSGLPAVARIGDRDGPPSPKATAGNLRMRARAKVGGRQEARTPDLRVANAALSQLS